MPRNERNLTLHSIGSVPSMKDTETVLGATATATVLQSSRHTFSNISDMATLIVSIPPGWDTWRLPRYQALTTFLGSSIGVGKVSGPGWVRLFLAFGCSTARDVGRDT